MHELEHIRGVTYQYACAGEIDREMEGEIEREREGGRERGDDDNDGMLVVCMHM